jgi:hypothetical protein
VCDEAGNPIMVEFAIRDRSQTHRGNHDPYIRLITRCPEHALLYDWVDEDDKERAREISNFSKRPA